MTKIQRIKTVLFALLMILAAILMILLSEDGYVLITLMIWLSLMASALRQLVYYFSMARHMVGGRLVLYKALIFLDLALFTMAVTRIPRAYILFYLSVLFGFSGLVDVLHSLESRRVGGSWHFDLFHGILNIILAGICLFFYPDGKTGGSDLCHQPDQLGDPPDDLRLPQDGGGVYCMNAGGKSTHRGQVPWGKIGPWGQVPWPNLPQGTSPRSPLLYICAVL